jgi:hypothetical protein
MMRRRPGDGFQTSPLRALTRVMVEALLADIAPDRTRPATLSAEAKENQELS